MTAMATTRRYAWHAVGALGVIELTAPGRAACVAAAAAPARPRRQASAIISSLHAVLDVKHSEAWNREALRPLVAEDPRRARGDRGRRADPPAAAARAASSATGRELW